MHGASCSIGDCQLVATCRGLCHRHYYRWRRYGDPASPRRKPGPSKNAGAICRVDGCERPYHAKDLCKFHHKRQQHGIPLDAKWHKTAPDRGCAVPDCFRRHVAKGLCGLHYGRQWRGEDLGPADRIPARGFLDRKGYHCIRLEGREYKVHRLIMERLLGRPLRPLETVHHCNTVKNDNRTDGPLDEEFRSGNLQLWTKSQPSGGRVIDKVAWAVELLELYAPDLLAAKPVQLRLVE